MRGDKALVLWFWIWLAILIAGGILDSAALFWLGKIFGLAWFVVIVWFALNYAEQFDIRVME